MMKKFVFLLLFLSTLAITPLMAQDHTYTINVDEFSKLKVVNDIAVRYVSNPDSAGMAVYTCEDRMADAIIFTNKGGTLKVSLHTDYVFLTGYLPTVTVYSSYLTSAENNSKASMEICNPTPCPEISLKQVGNGSIKADNIKATNVKATIATGKGIITLSGKADYAKYEMLGTGQIIADSLEANDVSCKVMGTGSIGCWPLDTLSVSGLASTTVYYKGNPTIKKTGVVKIERMP